MSGVLSTKREFGPGPGSALHQTPPATWPARRNASAIGDGRGRQPSPPALSHRPQQDPVTNLERPVG
jgi:hypothetical protein